MQGFAYFRSSERSVLEDDVKNLPIPKELQAFNKPGLKPDLPAEGERRLRRQQLSFDPADTATGEQTFYKKPKKSKGKKEDSRKKGEKHKEETEGPHPVSKATVSPVTTANAAADFVRQLQQGGGPLQGLVPAGVGVPGTGQQIVIQNSNVFVLPDPKK